MNKTMAAVVAEAATAKRAPLPGAEGIVWASLHRHGLRKPSSNPGGEHAGPIWRQKCPLADSRACGRVCQASLFPEAEGRPGGQWRC